MLKIPNRETGIVLLWLVIAAIFLYADHTFQHLRGPHGGTCKEIQSNYIELRYETQTLYCYLLDDKKNPLPNIGIHCDGRLNYPDGTSQNIKFIPYKEDGFIAQGISSTYSECHIRFYLKDRTINAVFETEQFFANKKTDVIHPTKKTSGDSN